MQSLDDSTSALPLQPQPIFGHILIRYLCRKSKTMYFRRLSNKVYCFILSIYKTGSVPKCWAVEWLWPASPSSSSDCQASPDWLEKSFLLLSSDRLTLRVDCLQLAQSGAFPARVAQAVDERSSLDKSQAATLQLVHMQVVPCYSAKEEFCVRGNVLDDNSVSEGELIC